MIVSPTHTDMTVIHVPISAPFSPIVTVLAVSVHHIHCPATRQRLNRRRCVPLKFGHSAASDDDNRDEDNHDDSQRS